MDETLKMNKFRGVKKAETVLHYIAEKVGWHYIPDTPYHFQGVRRLLSCDDDDNHVKHEFRLWYRSTHRTFYCNYGEYTDVFKEEPVNVNKYTIADIIAHMTDFDEQARKLELEDRKKDISVAANDYEA